MLPAGVALGDRRPRVSLSHGSTGSGVFFGRRLSILHSRCPNKTPDPFPAALWWAGKGGPGFWDLYGEFFLPWRNPHPVNWFDSCLGPGKWAGWGMAAGVGGIPIFVGTGTAAGTGGAAAGTGVVVDIYAGTGSAAGFGQAIGWGVGPQAALARAGTITLCELQKAGITLPVAYYWLQVYQNAVANGQGGETAPPRIILMQRVIEILTRGG
jgi:Domain of unknown function (DUF4951)